MTKRLYLEDPKRESFTALVVSKQDADPGQYLELDRTYFYIEGGGQPSDRGTIAGHEVLRVFEAEGKVWHHVVERLALSDVDCRVDLATRHDYSVQHTGQHVLSQAYWRLFSAATSSFHLTGNSVSIDLSHGDLSEAQIFQGEALANEIIRQGLSVQATLYDNRDILPEELRKNPVVESPIRVVSVGDFDTCPCAGTHVHTTAELQFVKVISTERTRGRTRVHFLSGQRAMTDFALRIESDNALAQLLSTPYAEQPITVQRLLDTEKQLKRERARIGKEVMQYRAKEAKHLRTFSWGQYHEIEGWTESFDDAKFYLAALAERQSIVAVLSVEGEPARIFIASSSPIEAGALLRQVYTVVKGKGGGNRYAAQGSVEGGELTRALEVLRTALPE